MNLFKILADYIKYITITYLKKDIYIKVMRAELAEDFRLGYSSGLTH